MVHNNSIAGVNFKEPVAYDATHNEFQQLSWKGHSTRILLNSLNLTT